MTSSLAIFSLAFPSTSTGDQLIRPQPSIFVAISLLSLFCVLLSIQSQMLLLWSNKQSIIRWLRCESDSRNPHLIWVDQSGASARHKSEGLLLLGIWVSGIRVDVF